MSSGSFFMLGLAFLCCRVFPEFAVFMAGISFAGFALSKLLPEALRKAGIKVVKE